MARRFTIVAATLALASFGLMLPQVMAQKPDAGDSQPHGNDRVLGSSPPPSDSRATKLAELHRLWKESSEFHVAGKPADAIERLTHYISLQRSLFGDKTTSEAQALEHIATIECEQQHWVEARSAAATALSIRETVHGPNDWHAVETRILMADVDHWSKLTSDQRAQLARADRLLADASRLKHQGKYREALPLVEETLALRRQVLGDAHHLTGVPWLWLRFLYEELHDAKNAEAANRRALEIFQESLGETHPKYTASLIALALLYQKMGDGGRAEPLYKQVLEILKKTQGEMQPSYIASLNNLAGLYDDMGAYTRAEPIYRQSLEIRKKTVGDGHPDYANSLNNLAAVYVHMGDYARAEPLCHQALRILKKTQGELHPNYAASLNTLAALYHKMGDDARAEPLYTQAMEICKRTLGDAHPHYIASLGNLATLHQSKGDYAQAESLYRQVLEIDKKTLGETHPAYARSLSNLASLYQTTGNYAQAATLLRQALKLRRQVLGEKHPDYALSLDNLAVLYEEMGDYAQAEPLCRQALEIRKKALGEMHPEYAGNLNDLALLYRQMGDYARAAPLYRQAIAIRKKVLGEAHPDYAVSLNNLAALYDVMGDNAQAELLDHQASEIFKKALGETHPSYAASLNNLAGLSFRKGDYARAESLYHQTLKILEQAQGETHPKYAVSLSNLGLVQLTMARPDEAEKSLREAVRIERTRLDLTATVQSERQQLAMSRQTRSFLDTYLTAALAVNTSPVEMFAQVAAWKGAVAAQKQLMRARQRALAVDPNSDLGSLFVELEQKTRRLAALYGSTPKPAEVKHFRKTMRQLSDSIESLQQRLSELDPEFHRQWTERKISVNELDQALLPDAALVDVLEYSHYIPRPETEKKAAWEQRFVAFVVRRDRPVVVVELGPSNPVGQQIDAWRASYGQEPTAEGKLPGSELRRLVWEPLLPALDGAKTVLVSPDGALARLPWGALPGEKPNTYLIEERTFAVLPVPQLLPELVRPATAAKRESLLLVGDVDFGDRENGKSAQLAAAVGRAAPRQSRDGKPAAFAPLPATRAEVAAIAESFGRHFPAGQARLLCKQEATEQTVRSAAPQYRYVHLATHGYFAPAGLRSTLAFGAGGNSLLRGELALRQEVTGYHPGLLSGIVLAGANRPVESDGDDGILTALEVAELDLSNVDLAVLSACETGLGPVAGGEGVLGLQRAFQIAGARNVVTSLWQVDDQATTALMRLFYIKLWEENKPPPVALREAQLAMLYHYDPSTHEIARGADKRVPFDAAKAHRTVPSPSQRHLNPQYWAAFVVSGY